MVLAAATFAAVRSSNRAARATERALLANLRPVLVPSREEDPAEKIGFVDNHYVRVGGGRAVAEVTDDVIYMAISLRNVGSGLAVLDRWDFYPERVHGEQATVRASDDFRRLTRDIYVSGNDRGFWQGAFRREQSDPMFDSAREAILARRAMTIDLLYGDHEGGQRTVTRFGILPIGEDQWLAAAARHWNLDRDDPR